MTGPLRVVFVGAAGRMGRALVPGISAAPGLELVAAIDRDEDVGATLRARRAEVAIDFTEPTSAVPNARAILAAGAQGVIGTTGFSEPDLDALDSEARRLGRGLLIAPNFALGMVLLQRFAEEAARHFPRIEVLETHHEGKKDAPSGTAQRTAERLARAGALPGPAGHEVARGLDVGGVRVHSLRLPGIMARQEVHFGSPGEALVLRHEALSRECYLPGVLAAVRAIPGRIGVLRGLESILFASAP